MTPRTLLAAPFVLGVLVLGSSGALGGPQVDVIVGSEAPELERFAARELQGQLERLFEADVQVGNTSKGGAASRIFVGSPATSPAVQKAIGDGWPELTDQGIVLRSVAREGGADLVVGGGSPVATLWAVYELGYQYGIRYLLSGDVDPANAGPLRLDGFELTREPNLRLRTWRTVNDFAIGPESWGLADQKRLLEQLAKNKFNRVLLSFYPWQPFVHYEFRGVKKQTALSWFGWEYRVEGDVAGRHVFRGAKVFENPDLAGKTGYEERTAAGIALARGIIDHAHRLGMTTAIAISPLEFPREFAAVLPEAKVLHSLESLVVGPGPRQPPDDPLLTDLVKTKIRAYLETYPTVDALYLTLPEFPDWIAHAETAWDRLDARTDVGKVTRLERLVETARSRNLIASGDRGEQALRGNLPALDFLYGLLSDPSLLARPGGGKVQPVVISIDPALFPVADRVVPPGTGLLHFIDYTARRVAENRDLMAQVPTESIENSLILTLADDNVGVLPQLATRQIHTLVGELRSRGWQGYSTRYWIVGDLDPSTHYLSRASFDPEVTPESSTVDLIAAMCGEGVAERIEIGFDMIEQATELIDKNELGFAFPVPGMLMKHYHRGTAPAEWWDEARNLYAGAMIEMYRGKDRAELPGRPMLLYLAKRLEFAFEYLNCVEALAKAGAAKRAGETDEVVTQLETATESIYNAINALGEVARDNCDRGLIAVLNEYGYRPILKEFEAQAEQRASE